MPKTLYFILAVSMLTCGCKNLFTDTPPANDRIAEAITALYQLNIKNVTFEHPTIIGKHYQPGKDSWNIVSCLDIKISAEESTKDCNNSFSLYKLDSNKWILDGKVNNENRWIELTQ